MYDHKPRATRPLSDDDSLLFWHDARRVADTLHATALSPAALDGGTSYEEFLVLQNLHAASGQLLAGLTSQLLLDGRDDEGDEGEEDDDEDTDLGEEAEREFHLTELLANTANLLVDAKREVYDLREQLARK